MISAIRLAKARGAELIILSDANSVFIDTILKAYDCADIFSHVVTNPATFDDHGRLKVRRWIPAEAPHGCSLCSLNMCKGLFFFSSFFLSFLSLFRHPFLQFDVDAHLSLLWDIAGQDLDAYLHGKAFGRKIYIGDSRNDYCPSLHLSR